MNNIGGSMNFFKKFVLFLILSLPVLSIAKTSIVFINGITTTTDGAQKNLNALRWRYCITYKNDCSNVEFKIFYNQTQGFFDDKGELTIQAQAEQYAIGEANKKVKLFLPSTYKENPSDYKIGGDEYNIFNAYLNIYLSNIYYEKKLDDAHIWTDSNILGTDKNNANSDVLNSFISITLKVVEELGLDDNTRKVVLVPHSQGNYFAQAVSSFLAVNYPEALKRFSVHGVASVSSVAQLKTDHTSHSKDQALLAHAVLDQYDRKWNFDAGWSLGSTAEGDDFLQEHPDDPTNHGFYEVYMGFKEIKLPIDAYSCVNADVPTESVILIRDLYRIKTGATCQEKSDVKNGTVLIGVGSQFSDLRGIELPKNIINKIYEKVNLLNLVDKFTISPLSATMSKDIVFTVAGVNLPSGMGFSVEDCLPSNNELPGGTTEKRQFRCTINGVPGSKKGVIKDKPGGLNTLMTFFIDAKTGNNVGSWISTITPPGFIVKQIVNVDFASLPDGYFTATGEYRINSDATSCNLSQTLSVSGIKNGDSFSIISEYTSPETFCPDGSHTAGVGYKDSYSGVIKNGVINLTNNGACSFYLSECYNYGSISPMP